MKAFLCSCRKKIPLPKLKDKKVELFYHDDLCSEKGMKFVKENIKEDESIMIAGCSPQIAERYFRDLNPIYVNIREQAAYAGHSKEKIKDLINGGLERLKVAEPVSKKEFRIKEKGALIIGSGISGLEAARTVVKSGHNATLIERRPYVGGTVADLDRLYPEGTPNSHTMIPLINDVVGSDVDILLDAELVSICGRIGEYQIKLKERKGGVRRCEDCGKCIDVCPIDVIDHGVKRKAIFKSPTYPDGYVIDFNVCNSCGECAKVCPGEIKIDPDFEEKNLSFGGVVVATGLNHFDAKALSEYGYGRIPNVMNHIEFERRVSDGELNPETVVIVHCAGSRDERYLDYCSGICCLIGLKEAKLVKDRYPETEVYVCYVDIRARGEQEYFYQTLRNLGVKFVAGRPGDIVEKDGKAVVKVEDNLSGELLKIPADVVVLSTGFIPDSELSALLPINLDNDQFPRPYEWSHLSVDSPPHAIFFAGSANFPMSVPDSLTDSRAKAYGLVNILSRKKIDSSHPVSKIDDDLCSLCSLCITTCPFGALRKEEEKVISDPAICMGCGICVSTCPSGASSLEANRDKEILKDVESLTKKGTILAFLCKWSAYPAADNADSIGYPESVRIIRVPCSGRVDPQMVLSGFSLGAKAVLIGGCYPEACHYHQGNIKARRKVRILKDLSGIIDPERLRIEWIGTDESKKFVEICRELEKI